MCGGLGVLAPPRSIVNALYDTLRTGTRPSAVLGGLQYNTKVFKGQETALLKNLKKSKKSKSLKTSFFKILRIFTF